jgi:heptosyltransferase-2
VNRSLTWLAAPAQILRLFESFFRWRGFRNSVHPAALAEARSVLIVRPDHLGDVILMSAFLREFRKNWPQAEITLLVDPASKALVEHCPYIDHLEVYPRWQPRAFGQIRRMLHEMNWSRQHLWPRRFDLAVVPRWETKIFREAFLAYLSGAKWRVSYSEAGNTLPREEESCEILYTHLAPSVVCKHDAQQSLDLLTWMGGEVSETRTEVWIDGDDRSFAAKMLPDSGNAEPVVRVVLMPGSSSASRRWPAQRFGEIAAWMTKELGWVVVLVGSTQEAELGEVIESYCSSGVVNLIGRTTVRQTIGIIGRCCMYVGNDTGPMHMASALGVPVIEISCHPANGLPAHERSPLRFGPWNVLAWIAQPAAGIDDCRDYCVLGELGEAHCILAVSVDQVKVLVREAAERCGLPLVS